ncbi:alpha/beta fold hydrolase [Sorangium sp. So ce394]
MLTLEGTRWQYEHGVADTSLVAPEAYMLDYLLLKRPGNAELQLDLFLDYANNVALYPKFQAFFRERALPTLAIWGKNDPFFIPPGAEAYRRDNPGAVVELVDSGHFALETHAPHIARRIAELAPADATRCSSTSGTTRLLRVDTLRVPCSRIRTDRLRAIVARARRSARQGSYRPSNSIAAQGTQGVSCLLFEHSFSISRRITRYTLPSIPRLH